MFEGVKMCSGDGVRRNEGNEDTGQYGARNKRKLERSESRGIYNEREVALTFNGFTERS